MTSSRWLPAWLLVCAAWAACAPAAAQQAAQLASAKGCYNCHGDPPRRNVPSFDKLVADYAALRGQPGIEQKLADRMHHGSLFSHVAAHERLTDEEALVLARWLLAGGKS